MDRKALIKALRDTVQSASNAVASNISGPIDLINTSLGALGMPVSNEPFGGSNWMRARGLTRDVEMGVPRVIGETLGLAGPAIVAAKAPQIASAINQGLDNLAKPSILNRQSGVIYNPSSSSERIYSYEGLENRGRDYIRKNAEDFADLLRAKNYPVEVIHSGSSAGPSSYVKSYPFGVDDVRFSGHSKGVLNNQFVRNVYSQKDWDELSDYINKLPAHFEPVIEKTVEASVRPAVFKATQEASRNSVPYTKAFTNSGKYIGPQTLATALRGNI